MNGLQKSIGPVQFVVFGFGSIVGTAWVLLLGGFLQHAGPVGAMLGIVLGGAAMVSIAAMYAELASRFPQTGGEVTYISAVFGKTAGFCVGWLLTLAYCSNLVFEGVALGWLAETLWPALTGPRLYVVLGQPVGAGGLGLALVSAAAIAVMNYRGAQAFVRFHNVLTVAFLLIVFATVAAELSLGSRANMTPLWATGDGGPWWIGAAWVFGSAPMIFNGFQSVLQAIEERSAALTADRVVRLAVIAEGAAIVFYVVVVTAAIHAMPWRVLASSPLPAAAAIAGLPWAGVVRTAFLLALIASLLKAWNAVFMTSVRLLFAQAREGMIPAFFGGVNPETGSPGRPVLIVAAFNVVGVFLGKGLLEPIVNVMSVCIASIFALICAATLVMRRRAPDHAGFRAWGGAPVGVAAMAAAVGMVVFALTQPGSSDQAAMFKWVLLGGWALIGLGLYRTRNRAN